MKIVFWILQSLLMFAMFMASTTKMFLPYDELVAQMQWPEDFSVLQIRLIAVIEFIGFLGLLLPIFIKKLPKILMAYAALGLGLTMLGAIATHVMRGDAITGPAVLFVLAALVFWKRYTEFK